MNIYNLNNIDKEIFANIYLSAIDELKIIFNIIPFKKILGPPDEFPYFKKIIYYIFDIIHLFESKNYKFYINKIYKCKNINSIIYILESLIDTDYQYNNNIKKYCKLYKIFENLYIIANFFHFPVPNNKIINFCTSFNTSSINFIFNNYRFDIKTNCVTNLEFFEFILNNGYSNEEFWSKEGLQWLKNYPKKNPYFWEQVGNDWYITKFDKYIKLSNILEQPVYNISYYEAEAYCKFKKVYLPKYRHLKNLFNKNNYSNHIVEWTSSVFNKDKNICFGNSYYNKLTIKNINDVHFFNKSAQHYFTGFRYIIK